jgi:hypothetical protein
MNHKFVNHSYHSPCPYNLIIIDYVEEEHVIYHDIKLKSIDYVEEEHVIYHDIKLKSYFLYLDSFDDAAAIDYLVSNNIGFISGDGPTITKIELNPHVLLEII